MSRESKKKKEKILEDTFIQSDFQKIQSYYESWNSNSKKIIEGLINDLKITDEKQKLKVFRAIDKISNPNIGISGVKDLFNI